MCLFYVLYCYPQERVRPVLQVINAKLTKLTLQTRCPFQPSNVMEEISPNIEALSAINNEVIISSISI